MMQNFKERLTNFRNTVSFRDLSIGVITASLLGIPTGLHLNQNVLDKSKMDFTAIGICVGSTLEEEFNKRNPNIGYLHGNGIRYDLHDSMHYSFISGNPAREPSDYIQKLEKLAAEGRELKENVLKEILGDYETALRKGYLLSCFT